jgi:hypothetical protein
MSIEIFMFIFINIVCGMCVIAALFAVVCKLYCPGMCRCNCNPTGELDPLLTEENVV